MNNKTRPGRGRLPFLGYKPDECLMGIPVLGSRGLQDRHQEKLTRRRVGCSEQDTAANFMAKKWASQLVLPLPEAQSKLQVCARVCLELDGCRQTSGEVCCSVCIAEVVYASFPCRKKTSTCISQHKYLAASLVAPAPPYGVISAQTPDGCSPVGLPSSLNPSASCKNRDTRLSYKGRG